MSRATKEVLFHQYIVWPVSQYVASFWQQILEFNHFRCEQGCLYACSANSFWPPFFVPSLLQMGGRRLKVQLKKGRETARPY